MQFWFSLYSFIAYDITALMIVTIMFLPNILYVCSRSLCVHPSRSMCICNFQVSKSSQFSSDLNKGCCVFFSENSRKEHNKFRVCWFYFSFASSLGDFIYFLYFSTIPFHDYTISLSCWCYVLSNFSNLYIFYLHFPLLEWTRWTGKSGSKKMPTTRFCSWSTRKEQHLFS